MFNTTVVDQIARLTMCSPPVNALSLAWVAGLTAEVDKLQQRNDWKVLIICSDQKVFCAGGDLREMEERFSAPDCGEQAYSYVGAVQRVYSRIETMPQIAIAEISGAALGGGFELALSCDLRIVATEAKIGLTEVSLGLIPGGGGSQRLPRLIGAGMAKRMIFSAEVVDGAMAEKIGIAQWAFARADVPRKTLEIAQRIAKMPAAALHAAKLCINASARPGRDGSIDELDTSRALQLNPESRELISAFINGAR